MARPRKPIEYRARYADSYFRSGAEVERELSELEEPRDETERTDERTNGSARRAIEREKTRHSFDVYRDQVAALNQIQAELYQETGKKPKLGDLVQEALDEFIASYRVQTHERTDEHSPDIE